MKLNNTHRDYEKEVRQMKDFNHTMLVGRKYFKSKSPNFLTFTEKEKIRRLHDEDPNRYTIDHLSQAFPADPHTISIIIRNRWTPKDTNRVQKHDESVKKNWEAFKEGKLEIDPMLAEHLKKFASRDFNHLAKPQPYKKLGVQVPKPRGNEFLSIITSCTKYAEEGESKPVTSGRPLRVRKIESEETQMPDLQYNEDDDHEMKLRGRKEFSKKNITLEQLQKLAPQFKLPKEEEKDLSFSEHIPKFKTIEFPAERQTAVSEFKSEVKMMESKDFIKIPKHLRQHGKIYQVHESFYSDDGEFLYRVPGIENSKN